MSGMSDVNKAAAASLGLDPATTDVIVTALGLTHVLQVYTSAMVTLAVWDWLVCLKMEWERVWKREWSLVKFIYLWTRYYGLVAFSLNLWLFNSEFSYEQCKTLHYLIVPTCMMVNLGSEAILAIRTYAFLGKRPVHGMLLGAGLLGEAGFLLYVAVVGTFQIPPPLGNIGPCTATDKPGHHIVNGFWLAPVAFDAICTGLTIWKAFSLRVIGVKSSLLNTFLQQGVLYFLAVAGINLLNAAFMFQSNPNIQNINCFLALILSQVLCCRLVLALRSNEHSPMNSLNKNSEITDQRISFAPPRGNQSTTGINIPLGRIQQASYGSEATYFSGVKVQVDVERDAKE